MEEKNCTPRPDNNANVLVSGFFAGISATLIALKWIFKVKI